MKMYEDVVGWRVNSITNPRSQPWEKLLLASTTPVLPSLYLTYPSATNPFFLHKGSNGIGDRRADL